MYTIRQAAQLTGVPETSLRAWERRYGVVSPQRTEAGYRIYDDAALAAVSAMRSLVDAGWAPAQAAAAVRDGTAPAAGSVPPPATRVGGNGDPDAATCMETFLTAARTMGVDALERSLDRGFALGSFEHVVDAWLFPALRALGDGWARGEIDVAGEHAASHAVHRRLSAAFGAAGTGSTGPAVVVGLPPDGRHELGALAFATALRRRGHDVLYLGSDVPAGSWQAAVRAHHAEAAVLSVSMATDRPGAIEVAHRLEASEPGLLVASGGPSGADLGASVISLPGDITTAADRLDGLLHGELRGQ